MQMSPMTVTKLMKLHKGNDVWPWPWSICIPQQHLSNLRRCNPYCRNFQISSPNQLVYPQRPYDHTIPLLPVPINTKPYRYSPLHKDEIERQVKELLAGGLITHSTSPFASPVLLVQKKDGTWRFSVDYKRLNSLTINNRFPLPIIEEILDELACTKFFTKLDMTAGYHQIRARAPLCTLNLYS